MSAVQALRVALPLVVLGALLAPAAGCTTGVRLGAHDAGLDAPAADGGEPCGPVVCGPGFTCCNASCGLCAPPGAACAAISCGGPCDPYLAAGEGACRVVLGYAWNGAGCNAVAGCTCAGADCGRLHADLAACIDAHAGCMVEPPCFSDADCAPGEYCGSPPGSGCSVMVGGGGACRARPDVCPPEPRPVCGCDGATYASPCEAAAGGTDVLFDGPCDACAPEDAAGEGICGLLLGEAWDGRACVPFSGCSCVGRDCEAVTSGPPCAERHAGCVPPDFPCGPSGLACARFAELCEIDPMGGARCAPAPPVCADGMGHCDCVDPTLGDCSDDGLGGVVIVQHPPSPAP